MNNAYYAGVSSDVFKCMSLQEATNDVIGLTTSKDIIDLTGDDAATPA